MIDTRIVYLRDYDHVPVEGLLVDRFTHTNERYEQTKDICLIYYNDWVARDVPPYFEDNNGDLVCCPVHVTRPVFRYVETSNDRLTIFDGEKSIYEAENKDDLMSKYTPPSCLYKEFYIVDWMYTFVNCN